MYFDEDLLLDIRLNSLDKYVKKFVITEATYTHNGSKKELKFDINKFQKFKDKIIYLVVDKQPNNILDLVDKLDSTFGIIKFREYLDVIQDYDDVDDEIAHQLFIQKISNLIHTNTMIEDWDMLEKEIEEKKYDMLGKMLVEVKEAMKDCLPRNNSFHLELEEVLDERFIISQIESGVFNLSNFQKLNMLEIKYQHLELYLYQE